MKGPGIKKNYIMKRTVELIDIVPTICYLMDLPVPREAEGGIIYQALEDPDIKIKEIRGLKKKYKLLFQIYEAEAHLSHDGPAY